MTAEGGKADVLLYEGRIYGHPESDSVAAGGGRILAHGSFRDLKPLVGPRTFLIRLDGRTVIPGLIDSHLHFLEAAAASAGVRLSHARTIVELTSELRLAAARTPPGNWIRAFGCDEALLREQRGPTRDELDRAAARHPLRIRHQTLHASWLNSRAIAALRLEEQSFVPPPDAQLIRDDFGKLTGLVVGMEQWLTKRLPPATASQIEARARDFSIELAAAGVTAFTDATVRNGVEEAALFARLVRRGAIRQRVSLMIGEEHIEEAEQARGAAAAAGIPILAAKFMGPREAPIAERVKLAIRHGLGCAFHATEIEELYAATAAMEFACDEFTRSTAMRIEHGGIIPPDHIARLAAIRAWVVTNPGFIVYRGRKYATEPGLIPHLYRVKTLLDGGVRLAAGTDAPVTPARPFAAIAGAISRTSIDGQVLSAEEKLDFSKAFALFATWGAELAGLDAGRIDPGTKADLAVLAEDPLALTPENLLNLQPETTIIDGRVVYERPGRL